MTIGAAVQLVDTAVMLMTQAYQMGAEIVAAIESSKDISEGEKSVLIDRIKDAQQSLPGWKE
ncbi:MAG: hypothetical protein IT388_11935 [Nitrospirales bacterium]|nr:hypothetical protein [Nitrospirales bacterium]